MTFEEFFTKKKIDLKALKAADEPLFEEFKAHYSAMGEKSFDHSKKFWFNKLRKSFHLAEEEVTVVKKTIPSDRVETTSPTTDTTAAKPTGFKPRFKAPAPSEPSDQKEEPKSEPPAKAAAGFKPRFKPGITKNAENTAETSTPSDSPNDTAPETAKPTGFKPRFKANVTKTAESASSTPDGGGSTDPATQPQQDNTAQEEVTAASKPAGFKPRFKAGITKLGNTAEAQATEPVQSASSSAENATTPSAASDSPTTETSKPTGFKPRFKAGVTKTANSDSTQSAVPSTEDTDEKQTTSAAPQPTLTLTESNAANPPVEPQQNDDTAQEQTTTNKPTGFKPRFKAGLTKIDKKEE